MAQAALKRLHRRQIWVEPPVTAVAATRTAEEAGRSRPRTQLKKQQQWLQREAPASELWSGACLFVLERALAARGTKGGTNAEKSEKSGEIGSIFCATPATNPQTLLFSHQIFSCPISWIFWRPWRCDFWQLPLEVNGLFYGCSWKLFEYVQFIKRNFLLSIFWAGWRP